MNNILKFFELLTHLTCEALYILDIGYEHEYHGSPSDWFCCNVHCAILEYAQHYSYNKDCKWFDINLIDGDFITERIERVK